jgi:D-serine deaminase-like pyridoxal phosphate-dependent protein
MPGKSDRDYFYYRDLFKGRRLPLAFVDLDRFDANVDYVADTQKHSGKTIRVASKSIRCPDLIRRVFDKGGPTFKGILAFTLEEGALLADQGFDDIIVAYPTVQRSDMDLMADIAARGTRIALVVDSAAQLKCLAQAGRQSGVILDACLEIDMSYRPVGRSIHLGVRRSPLREPDQAVRLARRAADLEGVAHHRRHGLRGADCLGQRQRPRPAAEKRHSSPGEAAFHGGIDDAAASRYSGP